MRAMAGTKVVVVVVLVVVVLFVVVMMLLLLDLVVVVVVVLMSLLFMVKCVVCGIDARSGGTGITGTGDTDGGTKKTYG